MTLGNKITKLRKENNYTQEQLADLLEVTRQSISKWECDLVYPETDKLIKMSELFNCSLDYLLKDEIEEDNFDRRRPIFKLSLHERKSSKMIGKLPLYHIGKRARGFIAIGIDAQGVIAIGLKARGIFSLGLLSLGLFSIGLISLGLLAFGLVSLGLFSAGCFSFGIFSTGAISFGIISIGAIAIGDFSIGALAIGKYFALGDTVQAMICIGDSKALGSVFQKVGSLSRDEIELVSAYLDDIVPNYLSWAKEIIKVFVLLK